MKIKMSDMQRSNAKLVRTCVSIAENDFVWVKKNRVNLSKLVREVILRMREKEVE